jgi:hypothetical protein
MPERIQLYRHRGTRAIQRMVEFAPSTGGLALWVKHQDLPPEINPGPIATDGTTIYYSAAFERLPVAAQAGLVAHEVLHIALRHPQRYLDLRQLLGDVDLELFNICADAIVNSSLSHLSWLELPATSVFLDQLILGALGYQEGVDKALLEWDVERLYRAIDDRQPPGQGRKRQSRSRRRGGIGDSQPGAEGRRSREQVDDSSQAEVREDGPISARVRALGAETDADLFPQPDAEKQPELEAEQAREWSERILRAHAGDGAHSMLRALIADLPKIRTPWEQILRTQLARGLSMQPNLSWSRPSRSYIANQGRIGPGRRLPWEPGISSAKSVPRLVVIVDVSGSIEDTLMERFAGEIEAITRRLEASLVLVIGDRQVQRVARFEGWASLPEVYPISGLSRCAYSPTTPPSSRVMTMVAERGRGPVGFRRPGDRPDGGRRAAVRPVAGEAADAGAVARVLEVHEQVLAVGCRHHAGRLLVERTLKEALDLAGDRVGGQHLVLAEGPGALLGSAHVGLDPQDTVPVDPDTVRAGEDVVVVQRRTALCGQNLAVGGVARQHEDVPLELRGEGSVALLAPADDVAGGLSGRGLAASMLSAVREVLLVRVM